MNKRMCYVLWPGSGERAGKGGGRKGEGEEKERDREGMYCKCQIISE